MGDCRTSEASPSIKQRVMITMNTMVKLRRTEPMMARGSVTEASLISSARE